MVDLKSLLMAVREGNIDRVAALLRRRPGLVRQRVGGATALHYAALYDRRKIVQLLLERGADGGVRDERCHAIPAVWARGKSASTMWRNLCCRGGSLGLHDAASMGCLDRVSTLLKEDPSLVNLEFGYGTPIHYACLWGQPEVVQLLLDHDANPNVRNRDGDTALAVALRQVHSGAQDTPAMSEATRIQIWEACRSVVKVLRRGR